MYDLLLLKLVLKSEAQVCIAKDHITIIFRYVQYCMKFVNMLLANEIKPILVFDGRHLPAKAHTEKKRRE